jgi:hypothetical protein
VNILFSGDNGATWLNVNPGGNSVAAAAGYASVRMPAIPTKLARLRVVDVDRDWLMDETDGVFEIREAAGIQITSPAQNDEIFRGSVTSIMWLANGIGRVNIDYSPNGGAPGTYTRIASNVDANLGNHTWQVPTATTPNARIRFTDMSGQTIAESGLFSIVDQVSSTLRVTGPNGGEVYKVGDPIMIRWEGTNVPRVNVRYSSDGGATWTPIASDVPALYRQLAWTAPTVPGNRYRVQVMSISPNAADMSDADFEVAANVTPSIALVKPTDGSTLYVGDTTQIEWTLVGIAGPIDLSLSVDDGATWEPIASLPAGTLTHMWEVPDRPTLARLTGGRLQGAPTARIKVMGDGIEASTGGFTIERPQVASLNVTSPNLGTEIWREGQNVTISWNYNVVQNVDIQLSTDGGSTWGTTIAQNVMASLQSYTYTVPHLHDSILTSLVVRVASAPGATVSDMSDVPFTFYPAGINSVGAITGIRETSLFGSFPNPFTTSTEIRWYQNVVAPVTLSIYNGLGVLVGQESTGTLAAGDQRLTVNAGAMPNGVYHYVLNIGGTTLRSQMTLTR